MYMKKIILVLVAVIILLIGVVTYFMMDRNPEVVTQDEQPVATSTEQIENEDNNEPEEGPTVIGSSVDGKDITAYRYGTGEDHLVFVGGIHGGYAWNTVLVAYELMDYLENNREDIPENIRVTVIPTLNPDALEVVVDAEGRFEEGDVDVNAAKTIASRLNSNDVDLNRNFDCDWQETGTWQSRDVSGGDKPFSEPESVAFRDFINNNEPAAVVVWYSAAGGVFASSCHNDVSDETKDLTRIFADASGYRAYQEFDFYEITGDMVNWLARENIPAISVLLSSHTEVEWTENRKGIEAIFDYYAKEGDTE